MRYNMMTIKRNGIRLGFTMVELILVIAIIGILASIVLLNFSNWHQMTIAAQLKSDLNGVAAAMENSRSFSNTFPTTIPATFTPSSGDVLSGGGLPGGTTYCITAINGSQSYNISQYGLASAGVCPVLNFDPGIVTSYPGTGTTITDLSGNGNNGTLMNGVGYNAANGGSLSFNGTNNYVDVGNLPAFDLAGSMSVDAWVKTAQTTYGGIVTKYSTPSLSYGYDLAVYTNKAAFNIRSGSNGSSPTAFSATAINDGNWHYIVGVFNGSNVTTYADGVAGSPISWTFGSSPSPTSLQMGVRSGGGYFAGQISNAHIYSKALSQFEISQSFNFLRNRFGI